MALPRAAGAGQAGTEPGSWPAALSPYWPSRTPSQGLLYTSKEELKETSEPPSSEWLGDTGLWQWSGKLALAGQDSSALTLLGLCLRVDAQPILVLVTVPFFDLPHPLCLDPAETCGHGKGWGRSHPPACGAQS